MDGWVYEWVGGWVVEWVDGWWVNELVDGRVDGRRVVGGMNVLGGGG